MPTISLKTELKWLERARQLTSRELEEEVSGHKKGDPPEGGLKSRRRKYLKHFRVSAEGKAYWEKAFRKVAAELGRDVQAFVLLMDAEEQHGFHREWSPSGFGPGKHFGYALQWFAMGAVLSALLVWNYRKKRFK